MIDRIDWQARLERTLPTSFHCEALHETSEI